MKIVVLNGSPKGPESVTMQYIAYLKKTFPVHSYETLDISRQGALLEKSETAFNRTIEKIADADLILWAFPLYYLLVHSSYLRFIELVFERGKQEAFRDTPTASLSTSIHFFDHTAHTFLRAICDDLGMHYLGYYSAHMQDLRKKEMRRALEENFRDWISSAGKGLAAHRAFVPLPAGEAGGGAYAPVLPSPPPLETDKKIGIITDLAPENSSLRHMVERIRESFPEAEMINLRELKMGPCAGCLNCGFDNHCVYERKDDFIAMYRRVVIPADILIFALPIGTRALSYRWQRYLERSFHKTHQPTLKGTQISFLIQGPLSWNPHIREILTGYTETMEGSLTSIISNESPDPAAVDAAIDHSAEKLHRFAEAEVRNPVSFLGLGGMKIFRDEIYGGLRFVFQKDHQYYRANGIYDFPQRRLLFRLLITFLTLISKIPGIRGKIRRRLKSSMILPYRRVLEKAGPC